MSAWLWLVVGVLLVLVGGLLVFAYFGGDG
jgi:hypothetical protein